MNLSFLAAAVLRPGKRLQVKEEHLTWRPMLTEVFPRVVVGGFLFATGKRVSQDVTLASR